MSGERPAAMLTSSPPPSSKAPCCDSARHQSYWLDLGRALAYSGRVDQEALAAFIRAERAELRQITGADPPSAPEP
ncbi:hypothetical protein ACQEVC_13675 [Plantactinospora sp. CA-294935]|uniref:hypothetical protein n=1 Tax=Plantactinospora sp. CA-294935 TaxID=3240012 RepID=UPI003D8E6991